MKKMKVMSVVGTRPEIIRLSETLKEFDRVFDHVLVHTGQNYDYELNEVFFTELGLQKPRYFLEAAGKSSSETVGNIISAIDGVLQKEKPDAFVVLGDTNSCMAAYSAKRHQIPVFHLEAGNRCFDERVPEELNRRIIDHMADINLVYSDRARELLLQEHFPADRVFKVGSPMFEVLNAHKSAIETSTILTALDLRPKDYFVLSAHREENIESEKHFSSLVALLQELAKKYKRKIVFSVHPRTRKKLEESKVKLPNEVHLLKPFGFFDYIKLQKEAFCVISDSGTISEESSILNFPAINIRESHERFEAMEEASVIMSGLQIEYILQAIEMATNAPMDESFLMTPTDYQHPHVSKKVARIVQSYTDYINRRVWFKS